MQNIFNLSTIAYTINAEHEHYLKKGIEYATPFSGQIVKFNELYERYKGADSPFSGQTKKLSSSIPVTKIQAEDLIYALASTVSWVFFGTIAMMLGVSGGLMLTAIFMNMVIPVCTAGHIRVIYPENKTE